MYKFIYKINQWWIIISDTNHFYYNHVDGSKSWSMPEAVDIADIDFDQLYLLFAKARGLDVGEEIDKRGEPRVDVEESEKEGTEESGSVVKVIEDVEQESDEGESEEVKGLDLGYSSSDEEEQGLEKEPKQEKNQEISEESDESEQSDQEEMDTNVDNLVDSLLNGSRSEESSEDSDQENETQHSQPSQPSHQMPPPGSQTTGSDLATVLSSLRSQINIYDPYSIVEEDLINELIKYPIFYKLKFNQKQEIYNEWAKNEIASTTKKYPTPKQLLLNNLFELKSQVKSGHYIDIESSLSTDYPDKKTVFLKYKNILTDQSKYEKANKSKYPNQNLKKQRLLNWLQKHQYKIGNYQVHGTTDFDKWVNLCNDLDLPSDLVQDECNWIVGDSKRLECYLEPLNV